MRLEAPLPRPARFRPRAKANRASHATVVSTSRKTIKIRSCEPVASEVDGSTRYLISLAGGMLVDWLFPDYPPWPRGG